MAEIDPIVAEILLKGDDEFLNSMSKIGSEAKENIEKLATSAEKGASGFKLLTEAIGPVEIAISATVAAMVTFIEQQTEISQAAQLLANSFGSTIGQLQGLEAVFASSGVKVEQFERFANRLTTTIAREWPAITDSIRNYATQNDAAQNRVTDATLRVQDAQRALMDNSAERSSRMVHDNEAIEASYIKLQFAAAHAASEQQGAMLSVASAANSAVAARQHLAELEGHPPSAAEKAALALDQARLAVTQADKSEQDARIAAQEKAAEASLKASQMQSAYDDLRRKAAKDERDDAEQAVKDHNRVRDAIIAEGEAAEKMAKFQLSSPVAIRNALDGVVQGNKDAAKAIDLTQVSVENLTKGIVAQAAASSKGTEPTGLETLRTISNLFQKDQEHLISTQERLAVVNRLAGSTMQALGKSASEILNVLEHDAEEINKLADATDTMGKKIPAEDIEKFRGALASLQLVISQLGQEFAAASAPAFTNFLNTVKESLASADGVLHTFVEGLKSLGGIVSRVVSSFVDLAEQIGKSFGLKEGTAMQILLGALVIAAAAFGSAWVQVPVLIGAVVMILGQISTHMEEIRQKIEAHRALFIATGMAVGAIIALFAPWTTAIGLVTVAIIAIYENWDKIKASMTDNAVTRFWERFLDVASKVKNLFTGGGWNSSVANPPGASSTKGPTAGVSGPLSGVVDGYDSSGQPIQSRAEGGPIRGPGSSTSDSIMARLSNGEFVMKAAAVSQFGVGFMHAINSGMLPGFASGGLVPSPVRMSGVSSMQPVSTLNLSLDGRTFGGFRGPKNTVDDLTNYAISRQSSAAGKNPSWMG
jgi:hypothetical protein